MPTPPKPPSADFERRLDELREEARAKGVVTADGIRPSGGPIPVQPPAGGGRATDINPSGNYYGLPLLKPPVWKWMIAVYFFVGGLAGMSALIAAAALLRHDWTLARHALWSAGAGAVLSPILLIWDLGRPLLFLHMLRVFKIQSPMSLGSWILSGFGAAAIPALILVEWQLRLPPGTTIYALVHGLAIAAIIGSAVLGIFLATYTGALLGVSAIPAWNLHHGKLPVHFGLAALGSAAGMLELLGHRGTPLNILGYIAAGGETLLFLSLEVRRHGLADAALHHGKTGWLLRSSEILAGPLALVLRGFGFIPAAAGCFLIGALLSRFAWLAAGRASACDPRSILAAQQGGATRAAAPASTG